MVEKGDIIDVELLGVETGGVEFKEVVMFNDGEKAQVGAPYVKDVVVKGEVLGEVKAPKLISFKYKRRKNYHRKKGHRQNHCRVKITDLVKS
ncbi:50S ribosomal protein L21 [Candidatus Aerophobetes bacterium]|uniref:50S ribosomal protein L21 n=1 Tax=Aerophobetes bacterium TaxID=2030807 RepID=A0A2A4WXQ4_UNCAE|nr:MAG: 50S ribosomal protein L21 [Candidatus Aerophobetes bacterium]